MNLPLFLLIFSILSLNIDVFGYEDKEQQIVSESNSMTLAKQSMRDLKGIKSHDVNDYEVKDDGFKKKGNQLIKNAINNSAPAISSYYGGTDSEFLYGIATDSEGNVFVTGTTASSGLIAFNGHQNTLGGGNDAFLAMFDSTGRRVWATYFGGNEDDAAFGIAIDSANNGIFIAGRTESDLLSTQGAHQTDRGGGIDGFIAYFDYQGSLQYFTYYGGTEEDVINGIATDRFGNAIIAGYTKSLNNISSNGNINDYLGGYDGFVAKFNPLGSRNWGTYAGGTEDDIFNGVTIEGSKIFIYGSTSSANYTTKEPFQDSYGGGVYDGWAEEYDTNGSLLMSSFYGGSNEEELFGLSNFSSGGRNTYAFAGYSDSQDLPGVLEDVSFTSSRAYFSIADSNSIKTRIFKGGGTQQAYAMLKSGNIFYLTGTTRSTDFGIYGNNIIQNSNGGRNDCFVAAVSDKASILYSTYWGADSTDFTSSIAIQPRNDNNIFIGGSTFSDTFLGNGGHKNNNSGSRDGFYTEFDFDANDFRDIMIEYLDDFCSGDSIDISVRLINFDSQSKRVRVFIQDDSENETVVLDTVTTSSNIDKKYFVPLDLDGEYSLYAVIGNEDFRSPMQKFGNAFIGEIALNGPFKLCEGEEATFSVTEKQGLTYSWQVISGGKLETSASLPSARFSHVDGADSLFVLVEVFDSAGQCGLSLTDTVAITNGPEVDITGRDSVCQGEDITYTYNVEPEVNYSFSVPQGEIINSSIPGEVTVRWNRSGRLNLRATDLQSGCRSDIVFPVKVTALPRITLEGPQETCTGCTETYTAKSDSSGGVWQFQADGGTIISENGNKVTVEWGSETGSKGLFATYTFVSGISCKSETFLSVLLTDDVLLNFTGDLTVCVGDTVTYFAQNSPDFTYSWSIDGGGEEIKEEGNEYTVYWFDSGTHNVSMERTRISDQSTEEIFKTVAVTLVPDHSYFSTSGSLCVGSDIILASINSTGSLTTSEFTDWQVSDGIIASENGNNITLQFDSEGEKAISLTMAYGDCSITLDTLLTIKPRPSRPIIFLSNSQTLEADAQADSYIWFRNDTILSETSRFLNPSSSGAFTVIAVNEGCRSEVSEEYLYVNISVEDDFSRGAVWYDGASLHFPSSSETVRVFSLLGKTLAIADSMRGHLRINLDSGYYFVSIDGKVYKIIVQ
ncbi:MAG: hypothetical protein Kapaf2KO_01300 [Candidatus Kapaibacteriales bacterium]